MAVTEEARNDLYNHLQETMGRGRAGTLMALLPPTDAATKGDLDIVRTELKGDIAELRAELYKVVAAQTLVLVMAMVAIVGAFG